MLVLLISAAGAFLVFLLFRYIVKTRLVPETQMHQRLRKIKYGAQVQTERVAATTLSDIPFVERAIVPIFRSITEFLLLKSSFLVCQSQLSSFLLSEWISLFLVILEPLSLYSFQFIIMLTTKGYPSATFL